MTNNATNKTAAAAHTKVSQLKRWLRANLKLTIRAIGGVLGLIAVATIWRMTMNPVLTGEIELALTGQTLAPLILVGGLCFLAGTWSWILAALSFDLLSVGFEAITFRVMRLLVLRGALLVVAAAAAVYVFFDPYQTLLRQSPGAAFVLSVTLVLGGYIFYDATYRMVAKRGVGGYGIPPAMHAAVIVTPGLHEALQDGRYAKAEQEPELRALLLQIESASNGDDLLDERCRRVLKLPLRKLYTQGQSAADIIPYRFGGLRSSLEWRLESAKAGNQIRVSILSVRGDHSTTEATGQAATEPLAIMAAVVKRELRPVEYATTKNGD